MPPRPVVVVIVVGWLAALGWLGWDRWAARLLAADAPPLTRDPSDSVAPRFASWSFTRQGVRAGSADAKMAPRSDKNFDLNTRIRDFDVSIGPAQIRMTFFQVTRTVTIDNRLVSLAGKAALTVRYLGKEEKVEAKLTARVEGGGCVWEHEVTFGDAAPVPITYRTDLPAASPFVPLDPLQKYPGLRPGQSWLVSLVDPVTEVGTVVGGLVLKKELGFSTPAGEAAIELRAKVEDATEAIEVKGKTHTCRVVVLTARGVTARVWVDEADDSVVRQEAAVFGQPVRVQRE